MIHRSVIRLSSAALLAGLVLGCGEKEFPTEPDDHLTVTPLFTDIGEGEQVQLTATAGIGGPPVPVTWQSSNTAGATVTAGGLVTGVSVCAGGTPPCTASIVPITATLVSDPTQLRTSNVSVVTRQGTLLQNGVAVTNLSGTGPGSRLIYRIFVPTGRTNFTVEMSGGTGDADLYVRRGAVPTTTVFDCRPFAGGNDETCPFNNPVSGTYYIVVEQFDPYTGVSLRATYTP